MGKQDDASESAALLDNALSSNENTPENTACEKSHPHHLPLALMSPHRALSFFF